jgi:RNA polymerase-interacting CarD/CdnL/TRCF family regulator
LPSEKHLLLPIGNGQGEALGAHPVLAREPGHGSAVTPNGPLAEAPYTPAVEFAIGKVVVYGGHGPGRVIARQTRATDAAAQEEVVVLELAAALTVTLPLALARQQLRPLANELELASVQRTLRRTPLASEAVWVKRQKATRAKLAAGEPLGLAEVVSDGAHRHQGNNARLSASERELYLKARRLLADEIGHARGIEAAQADDWISNQLAHAAPP